MPLSDDKKSGGVSFFFDKPGRGQKMLHPFTLSKVGDKPHHRDSVGHAEFRSKRSAGDFPVKPGNIHARGKYGNLRKLA
ncbi:MAG: hypothetical protein CMH76_08980 [Nitrospinae bacterium]|nr:hypothetical protein [Nitrospinota bacterium]